MENSGTIEWSFLFWDVEDKVNFKITLEKLNTTLLVMCVIHMEFNYVDITLCGDFYVFGLAPFEATKVKVVACKDVVFEITPIDLTTCSRLESGLLLISLSIPNRVMGLYFKKEEKLKNELKEMSISYHNWSLKYWDEDEVGL